MELKSRSTAILDTRLLYITASVNYMVFIENRENNGVERSTTGTGNRDKITKMEIVKMLQVMRNVAKNDIMND